MNTPIIQQPAKNTSKRPVPQMWFLTPYVLIVFACCAAFVLLAFFAMRGPDGSFDPENLIARMNAMPHRSHCVLRVAMLAFLALEFDFIGRLIAFTFVPLVYGRNTTHRRLVLVRLVVQACLLLVIMLGPFVAPRVVPVFQGWFAFAVFAALALPTGISAVEWFRTHQN